MLKRKAEQFPVAPNNKRICTEYDQMAIDPILMADVAECEVNGKEEDRFIPDYPMDDDSLHSLNSSMEYSIQFCNPAFALEQARQRLCEAEFKSQDHHNKMSDAPRF
jgi:hypothetical protein